MKRMQESTTRRARLQYGNFLGEKKKRTLGATTDLTLPSPQALGKSRLRCGPQSRSYKMKLDTMI